MRVSGKERSRSESQCTREETEVRVNVQEKKQR